MKAVNLIPADERKGAGGAAGRTGGAAYVLTGGLALIVAMSAAYAVTENSLHDKRTDLARVQQSAAASEAKAAALAPYTAFAALRTTRVQTISSIAQSRFDWAHAMRELGRTLPRNITLTQLTGSVSVSSGVSGGVALRSAYDTPALELQGCAPSQAAIPGMLTSLRRIDGVRRVALQQSVADGQGGAAIAGAGAGADAGKQPDCARTFQAVVFYDPKPAPTAAAASAVAVQPATGGAQ